jgi:hypothetical protein
VPSAKTAIFEKQNRYRIFILKMSLLADAALSPRFSKTNCPMTTAIIRSFEPDKGLVRVIVTGAPAEVPLRVCGSDKSVVACLPRGQHICFNLVRDRNGGVAQSTSRRSENRAHR